MKFEKDRVYYGFRLIQSQYIHEVNIEGYYFVHEHTGAKLVYLDSKDSNNVFSITFKTLPYDQSGVAHIVEHAVCCASKKYPLKDTFMEMDKGSLNTALNACTYKDMTMYYVASQNEKDLMQLMDVYMDLVFNPMLYEDVNLFRQEGWHYNLESIEGDLSYNGIVYNEMKGTFGEAGARLEKIVHEVLFEDHLYQYDSGGIPEEIVNLKWEDALMFHQKFYTADNATLFLYGDGNIEAKMAYLDTHYLQKMIKGSPDKDITIPIKEPFETPKYIEDTYPVVDDEEESTRNYMNLTFVVGQGVDAKQRLAFQVIEHMLLKSAASPLQQVLIEEYKLGTALAAGGYDPGKKQPTFAITLTGCEDDKECLFKKVFFDTIKQIVNNGIEQELIDAAIDTITFSLYEGESEGEPLGVLYSEDIQLSLHYGSGPFEYLTYERYLDDMRKHKEKGYFEQLLKEYFLDNSHYVQVVLKPSATLLVEEEEKEEKSLSDYMETLSKAQKKELVKQKQELEGRQLRENTKEELSCLPKLTKQDLKQIKKPLDFKIYHHMDIPIITTVESTHQISYYHVLLNAQFVKKEEWPYLGVLATLLTYVSTESSHYTTLENRINSQTGALNCTINAYANTNNTNAYTPFFKISTKMLDGKSEEVIGLLREIMTETIFSEKEKIDEILKATLYEIERSFTGAPEYRAAKYVYKGFSKAAEFEDSVSGVGYYNFLKNLCENYNEQFDLLVCKLQELYNALMTQKNLQISLMAREDQVQVLVGQTKVLCESLNQGQLQMLQQVDSEIQPLKEGIMTSSDVQAVAWGGNIKMCLMPFSGAWYVVAQFLESNYLWDKIRLQGGAYGCDLTMSRDGNVVVCSYCDPQIKKTLKAYRDIGEYLEKIEIDEEIIERYIIKTVGILDYPLTTEQKSERATIHYLCGVNQGLLDKERQEVLETTTDDFKRVAQVFKDLVKEEHYCIIGNKNKVLKTRDIYQKIREI